MRRFFSLNKTHARTAFTLTVGFVLTIATVGMYSGVVAPIERRQVLINLSKPEPKPAAAKPTSGDSQIDELVRRTGARQGVDPRFIHAVMWKESNYKPDAISAAGAIGLMQLMPGTARRFGCDTPRDKQCNIEAGTRYLRFLLDRHEGDIQLALASYNAGEGAVEKFGGIPPHVETRDFVRRVAKRYGARRVPVTNPFIRPVLFTRPVKRATGKTSD